MKRRIFITSSLLTLSGCASTSDPITTAIYGDDYSWFNSELRIFNPSELKLAQPTRVNLASFRFFNNGTLIEDQRSDYWEAVEVIDKLKNTLKELNIIENTESPAFEISVYRDYLSKGTSVARFLLAPLSFTRAEQITHGKVTIRYKGFEVSCEGDMIICPLSESELEGKNGVEVLRKVRLFSARNNLGATQSRYIEYFAERLAPQLLMNAIESLKTKDSVFSD